MDREDESMDGSRRIQRQPTGQLKAQQLNRLSENNSHNHADLTSNIPPLIPSLLIPPPNRPRTILPLIILPLIILPLTIPPPPPVPLIRASPPIPSLLFLPRRLLPSRPTSSLIFPPSSLRYLIIKSVSLSCHLSSLLSSLFLLAPVGCHCCCFLWSAGDSLILYWSVD